MAALQGSLPGFDPESTLLKVLSLHPIDTSKTHVGLRLGREICELLEGVDVAACGPELVDALAEVADRHGRSSYDGLSFASRFAHHFVDSERFPVLDAWSDRALQHLVGGERAGASGEGRYAQFARNFAWVASRLDLNRRRRLGRWLWLAGQYAAWRSNPRTPINRAVRELFEQAPAELAVLELPAPVEPSREPRGELPEPPPALPRSPASPLPTRSSYVPRRSSGGPRS
jgi:hypothetical protein